MRIFRRKGSTPVNEEFLFNKDYIFIEANDWSMGGYIREGSSSTTPYPEYGFKEVTFKEYYEAIQSRTKG